VLFGPQEYAVVATTPATSAVPPGRDVPPLIKLG
jgi:hypothetical protein